jgi:hypothetical protein
MTAQERLPALRWRVSPAHHILGNAGLPISIPSLSSSPWIRGAPHKGLAMLISRINCRISVGTAGRPRPRLDFQRQNNRKPARCHRTTVSGRTMASASRAFGNRRQTQPRTILSTARNGTRLGLPRRSTMICCRSTRISASNDARGQNRSTTIPKIMLQRSHIQRRIVRFSADCQPDQIYDRDSLRNCVNLNVMLGAGAKHGLNPQEPARFNRSSHRAHP